MIIPSAAPKSRPVPTVERYTILFLENEKKSGNVPIPNEVTPRTTDISSIFHIPVMTGSSSL